MKVLLAALGVAAALGLSCGDHLIENEAADQGNETAGVPQGEFHRPGQRCTACHQDGSEASDDPFTLAGTIFASQQREVGVDGVQVLLTDAAGTKYTAQTNCVGNFFVKASEWSPQYPIIVALQKGTTTRSMSTAIGRETDCAGCHRLKIVDPLSQLDHIYLFSGDEPGLPDGNPACKYDPVRPGTK